MRSPSVPPFALSTPVTLSGVATLDPHRSGDPAAVPVASAPLARAAPPAPANNPPTDRLSTDSTSSRHEASTGLSARELPARMWPGLDAAGAPTTEELRP